ncbi:MAG: polysaccharide deacetylase family protein [Ruminococcus sp.]|nr:polysaccharide deacetylase family protein [Ruminococcus sp.]
MLFMKFLIRRRFVILSIFMSLLILIFGVKIGFNVYAKNSGVRLSIIMYHSVLKDESQHGEYVLSPVELEKDLSYLFENGYTTITSSQLISFVYSGESLPDKPVMLTFDDGCLNNLTYVLPLLEKYNMKAVFSVVGSFCDREEETENRNDSYSYLNWEEVRKLYLSGKVDIACHSYDFHSLGERQGATIKSGESYSDYRSVFLADTNTFLNAAESKAQIVPSIYTYPYGLICEESKNLVKACGFKISLGCEEKINVISDENSLYCLGRFNRPSGISTSDFMKKALP